MFFVRVAQIGCCAFLLSAICWARGGPAAVSPGDATNLAAISDACPTFSWTAAPGAKRYELVVYAVGESEGQAQQVLKQSVPAGATSWTPSLEQCLERGGKYAWSVRAVGGPKETEWSAPNLFQVASGPSAAEFEAALEIVRQYVAESSAGASSDDQASASTGVQSTWPVSSGLRALDLQASLAPAAAGDSDLMVNDAAVVTTATLGAGVGSQLCAAVDYRFVDLNDGTVLDCNTGLIWLKDADCLGTGTWDNNTLPPPEEGSAQRKVIELNLGTNPSSCEDYVNGTYTDWQLPEIWEFCSRDSPTPTGGLCPLDDASDSLVNRNFLTPSVGNAAGDGQWAADDAFVGVQSGGYWSATAGDAANAWIVNLDNGAVVTGSEGTGFYIWPVRGGQ